MLLGNEGGLRVTEERVWIPLTTDNQAGLGLVVRQLVWDPALVDPLHLHGAVLQVQRGRHVIHHHLHLGRLLQLWAVVPPRNLWLWVAGEPTGELSGGPLLDPVGLDLLCDLGRLDDGWNKLASQEASGSLTGVCTSNRQGALATGELLWLWRDLRAAPWSPPWPPASPASCTRPASWTQNSSFLGKGFYTACLCFGVSDIALAAFWPFLTVFVLEDGSVVVPPPAGLEGGGGVGLPQLVPRDHIDLAALLALGDLQDIYRYLHVDKKISLWQKEKYLNEGQSSFFYRQLSASETTFSVFFNL